MNKNIKKLLINILFILSVLLLSTGIIYFKKIKYTKKEPARIKTTERSPAITPTIVPPLEDVKYEIPEGDTITIDGIKMNNFYKMVDYIGPIGDARIINKTEYQAIYFPLDKGFLIAISGSPFYELKEKAEKDLIDILQLNDEDKCKAKIFITTSVHYNPNEGGINFRLNGCE